MAHRACICTMGNFVAHRKQLARRQSDDEPEIVRMRMPCDREAVAPTVERVLKVVEAVDLSEARQNDLATALAEALANAALHGNGADPSKRVSIAIELGPGRCATIEVRDSGDGFDADALPDPTDPSNLFNPSGRGVFLMRRLVDKLEYNDKGNCVRLTVRRRRRRTP